MYKVIYKFSDLHDNNAIYNVGDEYPRKGYEPTKERVVELSGAKNKVGRPLIEKVKEPEKKQTKSKTKKASE